MALMAAPKSKKFQQFKKKKNKIFLYKKIKLFFTFKKKYDYWVYYNNRAV